MAGAFAWIGQIVEWFGQFFPRWILVRTTHGAVKFVRGWKTSPLGPGLHFYWPATTEILVYPTARQAVDLRTQTVMTTDGKVFVVGGLIVYEVVDIVAALAKTYDTDATIKDVAMSAFHDALVKLSWVDIRTAQEFGTLNLRIRKRVRKELKPYGVKVIKVTITDLAPTRVLKLIQSTQADGL
jgi:regulator of protease activity HflC (stomatin/prohibitin superfamily)